MALKGEVSTSKCSDLIDDSLWRSRYGDGLHGGGFIPDKGKIFLLSTAARPTLGTSGFRE
jgi:hypothetical protein